LKLSQQQKVITLFKGDQPSQLGHLYFIREWQSWMPKKILLLIPLSTTYQFILQFIYNSFSRHFHHNIFITYIMKFNFTFLNGKSPLVCSLLLLRCNMYRSGSLISMEESWSDVDSLDSYKYNINIIQYLFTRKMMSTCIKITALYPCLQ